MGSFQITYNDFTGGHYMGNRETEQPSNAWTGTNTVLDPRGNLIASFAIRETVFDTGIAVGPTDGFNVVGCFTHPDAVTIVYTHRNGSTFTTAAYVATYFYDSIFGWSWNTPLALSGVPVGFMAPDQTVSNPTLYYVASGNIRKLTYTKSTATWADVLVTSGTSVTTTLYKYKYRLLGLGLTGSVRNRLYYSDPTMTSWSATDYYEFPGQITNLVTRTNDLVVTTTAGIYSVTGVLGESINIQEIYSFHELSQGMANAVGYGRDFIYLDDFTSTVTGQVYAGLGTNKTLIATTDLESSAPMNIGPTNPGKIVVMANSGETYAMDFDGSWTRFKFSDWVPSDTPPSGGLTPSAVSLAELGGNMYLAQSIIKPFVADDSDSVLYVARVESVDFNPTNFKIKLYKAAHRIKSPSIAEASVILSDYWHQKPMVVREVVVEVEYVNTTTNASVAVNIIPIGAVDINSTVAPTMTSSTITAPSQSTAGSTIIHRFFVNNAGRAYGFKPQITHKGVRVKRIVCICED